MDLSLVRIVRRPFLVIIVLLMALTIAACGSDPTATPTPTVPSQVTNTPTPSATATPMVDPTATPEATATAEPATGALVTLAEHETLGNVLADEDGNILYLFTNDERNVSNCTGGCLGNWPPLVTEGTPQASEGVAADRLGAIEIDGGMQATYNGWPLYYFASDAAPGDATGQARGDVWYVVSAHGGPIFTSALVEVAMSDTYGPHLVDNSGRVQYLFTRDTPEASNCSGNCALNWPPLLTVDAPTAGEDVTSDRLGTIAREDGSMQVTYNGWPLYYFAQDAAPGDTTGQDVGGIWYLISPEGGPIKTEPTVRLSVDDTFGEILTDGDGRVLYLFTNDEPNTSNCSGNCALNWPPLLTVEDPNAGSGADAGLLGTISRANGSTQVTYDGWPLYYYVQDAAPGDKNGQARGDVWWVVNAEGDAVMAPVQGPVSSPIVGFSFTNLTITAGETVRWTNNDSAAHDVTSGTPGNVTGLFASDDLSEGDSFRFTFPEPGTFAYFCSIHPSMTGTVTVTE